MTMTRPTTEQITHNGQILKDVLGPVYNVMAFGAKGDGVTDDTPAFQAAIDALKANGGGMLIVPATDDGYFVPYTKDIKLNNANGITILGSQSKIMLQASPSFGAGLAYVFTGTNCSNVTINGLRFESASLVLRYNNGETDFDAEVNAGRASATDQTNWRYPIGFFGTCSGITIENCRFGYGTFYPIAIKDAPNPGDIKNVRLLNLDFDGVNSQCLLASGIDGAIISNITSRNSGGCKFDQLFYIASGCSNLLFSNIYQNTTKGSMFHWNNGGSNFQVVNAICENSTYTALIITNVDGVRVSQFTMNNVSDGMTIRGGSDIDIGGVHASQLTTHFANIGSSFGTSNCVIRDFSIADGSGTPFQLFGGDVIIRNGTIIDGASQSTQRIIDTSSTGAIPGTCVIDGLRIVFESYVPTQEVVDLRHANHVIDIRNCDFISNFGTATSKPVMYTDGLASVSIYNCTTTGWSRTGNQNLISTETSNRIPQLQSFEETLAVNSATPSVAGFELVKTGNTSATTITNFTGGVQGQQVWIRVADANTTFDFTGTSLKGNGGVDFTAASGDVIQAKLLGTLWYCTIIDV